MKRTLLVAVYLLAFCAVDLPAQNVPGAAAVYSNSAGSISPSLIWVDASQFGTNDICLAIQSAIASLPISPMSSNVAIGGLIDARNFVPPGAQKFLTCTVNPFSLAQTNTVVLVNNGFSGGTTPTPGSAGGVVLLPGAIISTKVPWLVPGNWSIFGQGSRVTTLAPAAAFTVPSASGNVSVTGGNSTVTGTDSWSSENLEGAIFLGCASTCTAAFTNATVVGIVTSQTGNTTLTLGTVAQNTLLTGSNYTFLEPLMAWATTTACPSGSCAGALQTQTFGSVIQDIGLNCGLNAATATAVSGCVPFWDQYGQERSQLKRLYIATFTGFGIGIYTINAQNGGPFDDLQMVSGPITANNPVCIEVGGAGLVSQQQPPMRGIRGLTCTGPTMSPSAVGIGIDINTQNFSLSGAHFEDFNVGVEIGSLTSARAIAISDVTGGANAQSVNKIVDISSNCATTSGANCQSTFATSGINVQDIYQPSTTAGVVALMDNITGKMTSEVSLGSYDTGDGSGLGVLSSRAVVSTSSSLANSLEFFTNATGNGQSNNLSGSTTVKLWGFSLPDAINTSQITFWVSSLDTVNTNLYNLGIYDSAGNKRAEVGATASSTLFGATSMVAKTVSWLSSTTLLPGKYYFATATQCAGASCTNLGGAPTGTFAQAVAIGSTSAGVLPSTITPPADSWTVGNVPSITIH